MSGSTAADVARGRVALAGALLVGAAVALALGLYAKVHSPATRPLPSIAVVVRAGGVYRT